MKSIFTITLTMLTFGFAVPAFADLNLPRANRELTKLEDVINNSIPPEYRRQLLDKVLNVREVLNKITTTTDHFIENATCSLTYVGSGSHLQLMMLNEDEEESLFNSPNNVKMIKVRVVMNTDKSDHRAPVGCEGFISKYGTR